MKFLKSIFFNHSFLFAIFPILFLYSHNIEKLSFSNIYISFLFVLFLYFLIFFLSKLISINFKKNSLITSLALLLFFSYGYVMEALYKPWLESSFLPSPSHKYLLSFWLILLFLGIYLIKKTQSDLLNLNKIITVIAISLVIFPVIKISLFESKRNRELNTKIPVFSPIFKNENHPDIYYIILDEYTSSENLKKFFNFDNYIFINHLKKLGFIVPEKSHSNYSVTYLSLASSLNMEYINFISNIAGKSSTDWTIPYNMVINNKVVRFLKSNGYQFLHFSSHNDATDFNKNADINYSYTFLDNFFILLAQTTILKAFVNVHEYDLRKNILYTFSELKNVYKLKGNKFIFAHIVCPHFPYIFDENGSPVKKKVETNYDYLSKQKENYINQMIFMNKKIDTLVNIILSKSETPPIIIIQGDHGSSSGFENLSLQKSHAFSTAMLQERMGILNAYYLPKFDALQLFDSITPVNTFRLIFNKYFHAEFKLLKNKNYFSFYDAPYKFVDATEIINKEN